MQAELAEAKAQLRRSEEREREALGAKGRYKEQVSRLAAELAGLHRSREDEQRQQGLALGRHFEAASSWGRGLGGGGGGGGAVGWGGGRDPSELEAIRSQLQALKSRAGFGGGKENASPSPDGAPEEKARRPQTAPVPSTVPVPSVHDLSPVLPKEIRRLRRERAALLETGVYEEGDPLVREIDRRLGVLEAQDGNGRDN